MGYDSCVCLKCPYSVTKRNCNECEIIQPDENDNRITTVPDVTVNHFYQNDFFNKGDTIEFRQVDYRHGYITRTLYKLLDVSDKTGNPIQWR